MAGYTPNTEPLKGRKRGDAEFDLSLAKEIITPVKSSI
jgi:hypothetical protein